MTEQPFEQQPEEPNEYGIVMPFVVCVGQGGTYEDRSFVAGFTAATIDNVLATALCDTEVRYVPPALLPQLDLSAMRHGWSMTSEACEDNPDEWSLVVFTRAAPLVIE